MEANKEESDRCIQLAQKYLSSGDRGTALKFVRKAEKLNPNSKTLKVLLSQFENDNGYNKCNGHDKDSSDASDDGNLRSRFRNTKSQPDFKKEEYAEASAKANTNHQQRNRSKSGTRTSSTNGACPRVQSTPQLGVDYTEEQVLAVQRIRHCKDYYEMLNVGKDAVEIDLKKQYKKLALQFHPDKNRAPGATEAFKAISNAYAVLCDPKKRERYDMYGSADQTPSVSRNRNTFYEYDYSHGFEAEMSAEDIFNMFFGGAFNHDVNRRRTHQAHHHRFTRPRENDTTNNNESGGAGLLQFIPLLLLIFLSICSQLLVPESPFSLHRTDKFTTERRTSELNVVYYVKPDFVKQNTGNIYRIEQQVEEEYIQLLRANCFREKNHRETVMWRARNYGDSNLYEKAQALKTPSCDRLTEIYS